MTTSKEPPRKIIHLVDDLEMCFEQKWVEDRLGGYVDTRLNRKKARKVIEKWLKNSTPQSRV